MIATRGIWAASDAGIGCFGGAACSPQPQNASGPAGSMICTSATCHSRVKTVCLKRKEETRGVGHMASSNMYATDLPHSAATVLTVLASKSKAGGGAAASGHSGLSFWGSSENRRFRLDLHTTACQRKSA
jgi:hypothetical protein